VDVGALIVNGAVALGTLGLVVVALKQLWALRDSIAVARQAAEAAEVAGSAARKSADAATKAAVVAHQSLIAGFRPFLRISNIVISPHPAEAWRGKSGW
jgi:hypothetical protein